MTTEKVKRKLTAILSADVKGYSRLMGEDEEWTLRTLNTYKGLIGNLVGEHRGRVVGSPGDNVLAEFASVVDAVECAVEIQQVLRAKNALLPETRKMYFRIGINLGDVIEEADSIYGDGVNIAARLEGLAEAGGICISGSAYEQIENKIPLRYDYLGEHTVKNITKPVKVYRARIEPEGLSSLTPERKPARSRWSPVFLAVLALVLIAGVAALYQFALRPTDPKTTPAAKVKTALPLPDKPSIAVLPFKNLSGSPEQEFLADGITESIIGAISRASGLFVIASNSVFTYKGKPAKVQTVGEELGVRNILEGTVQKAGDRLRINAQLIDVSTGRHVWSDKYDREIKDVFAIQDDISKEILTALRIKMMEGEQERVFARGTVNLEAYLKFLEAYDHFKSFSKKNMILARQLCEEAIGLDPKYEAPYALLGTTHLIDLWLNWGESPKASMEKAIPPLQKAVALRPTSDFAYACLGHLYLLQKRHDEAVTVGEKAVALNPNGDMNMVLLGITFNYVRRYEDAISLFKEGQRRNPYCPAWYIHNATLSNHFLGKWDQAIAEGKRALARKPDHFHAMTSLATVYGNSGRLDEGRAMAAKILKIDPGFSLAVAKTWPFKYQEDLEYYKAGFRKVGIPENPPNK